MHFGGVSRVFGFRVLSVDASAAASAREWEGEGCDATGRCACA